MAIAVPRDRHSTFEPRLIPKGQTRFEGFDEKIIALYAGGLTVREIQGLLLDQVRVEVGHDFISTATDAVLSEVVPGQNRPLERLHPMIAASWRRHWTEVIPFYDCPAKIHKMIYPTTRLRA